LILLKKKCEDSDPIISITASQGVVALVEDNIMGVIPTLSSFIATLPTVRFILLFLFEDSFIIYVIPKAILNS
jgi:hypothetical protein